MSVVPISWVINDKYSYWPKSQKNVRNFIIKSVPPDKDWKIYEVMLYGKYGNEYKYLTPNTYKKVIDCIFVRYCKKANESATESEEPEFLRKRRKRSIMPNELSVSPPPCLEDVVTEGKKNHAGFF